MEGGSGKSEMEDNTEENLVQEEHQNKVSKDNYEVKYISEIQNGETKMDCDMRRAFVGLGKEELMKFANDPFWVLTRQFLFILFWVMWVGMLVGSIAIVMNSPKCTSAKKPWFKDSLVYKFDVKAFEYGSMQNRIGDLKALKDHLHYFEYLGVDTVLVNSLMEGTDRDPNTIKDFKKIDSFYGSLEILKNLTKIMKEKGLHLIMSFDPNHSSDKHEWFRNSIARIDPYTNYYIWAQGLYSSDDNTPLPPNNWHSLNGGSAWSYVKERDQFYLHQFSSYQPDLNFREQKVVDYFKEVLLYWLGFGLSGLHINGAKYFIEDSSLVNETINPMPGATHDDYSFYSHAHTTFNPLTLGIIKEWAESLQSLDNVLSISDFEPDNSFSPDSPFIVYHTMKLGSFINASEFDQSVKANLGRQNPTWQWECRSECPDEETAKALLSIFVLLPGVAVIRGGEELSWPPSMNGPWSSEVINGNLTYKFDYFLKTIDEEKSKPESYLSLLKSQIGLREKDALRLGSTDHHVLNSTVFAFTREYSDEGYLVAYNFDDSERLVFFDVFKNISNDTELSVVSITKKTPELSVGDKTKSFVTIPRKTLLVFQFNIVSLETVVSSS